MSTWPTLVTITYESILSVAVNSLNWTVSQTCNLNVSFFAQFAKIEAFIDFGVPLNRFYEGKTPLMYAAEFSSSTKIIKLLLDNGAVPAIRSAEGKTAFEYAQLNTQLEHDETYWSLNSR